MPDAAYLSAADLRSVKPLDDTTRFPSALLEDFVSEFEEIVEQHLGAAVLRGRLAGALLMMSAIVLVVWK